MTQKVVFDHIALLVSSVENSASVFGKWNYKVGAVDRFKETNEIYIADHVRGRILFMEPAGPGSYQMALAERGPGIHHIAINVLDIEKFISGLQGSGWYLHTHSLHMLKESKTAYLARPAFPLIEVQEYAEPEFARRAALSAFVTKIEIPLGKAPSQLFTSLGVTELVASQDQNCYLNWDKHRSPLIELVK